MSKNPKILIAVAGFDGIKPVKKHPKKPVEELLIDRNKHLKFQPLQLPPPSGFTKMFTHIFSPRVFQDKAAGLINRIVNYFSCNRVHNLILDFAEAIESKPIKVKIKEGV